MANIIEKLLLEWLRGKQAIALLLAEPKPDKPQSVDQLNNAGWLIPILISVQ